MEIANNIFISIIMLWFLKIAYIDQKIQYIYDKDLIGILITIIAYQLFNDNFNNALLAGLFGLIAGFIIFLAAYVVYKEEAFGLGDVYLMGVLGCFFGWPDIIHFISFSFLFGGIVAALVLIKTRNRNYRMAFGPILVISIPLYYLCGSPNILHIFSKIAI